MAKNKDLESKVLELEKTIGGIDYADSGLINEYEKAINAQEEIFIHDDTAYDTRTFTLDFTAWLTR